MFTVNRTYNGLVIPVAVLYVDSLHTAYSFENITIEADSSDDELTLEGATNIASFDGESFPLAGSSYTTAQTGTLIITVTQTLATGLYYLHFRSGIPLPALSGIGLSGMIGLGTRTLSTITLPTLVQVQSFEIPAPVAEATGITQPAGALGNPYGI